MVSKVGKCVFYGLAAGLIGGCQPKEPPALSQAPVLKPAAQAPIIFSPPPPPVDDAAGFAATRVLSERDAQRLRQNQGMTLQWITWDKRSPVLVEVDDRGVWMLTSEIRGDDNSGMKIEGYITEVGRDYFLIDAEITIIGTPDASRFCDVNKSWRFAVTQDRKYYRLREFEWCDGLTDYIDIYFE